MTHKASYSGDIRVVSQCEGLADILQPTYWLWGSLNGEQLPETSLVVKQLKWIKCFGWEPLYLDKEPAYAEVVQYYQLHFLSHYRKAICLEAAQEDAGSLPPENIIVKCLHLKNCEEQVSKWMQHFRSIHGHKGQDAVPPNLKPATTCTTAKKLRKTQKLK